MFYELLVPCVSPDTIISLYHLSCQRYTQACAIYLLSKDYNSLTPDGHGS